MGSPSSEGVEGYGGSLGDAPVAKKRKSVNKVALSFGDEDSSSSEEGDDEKARGKIIIPKLKKVSWAGWL